MAAAEAIAHQPVLAEEAVTALLAAVPQHTQPVVVDATFGGGGHSRRIIRQLPANGRLLALDCDETAAARAARCQAPGFIFARRNYSELAAVLAECGIAEVCGILFDLGVSSMQLDDGARGFSFNQDAPLDMRMDRRGGLSAAEWLQQSDEEEICRVLRQFGQEPEARRIARRLAAARQRPATTAQLAQAVREAKKRPTPPAHHPATRTFQAIRIAVNDELGQLQKGLDAARRALAAGGRLVVIAFHSLEDRMVKQLIPTAALPGIGRVSATQLQAVGRLQRPSEAEIAANPRARSARMRVFRKLGSAP